MSPGDDGSVWTVDMLKQHFDQRLLDQDKAVQAALAAAEKAVGAALTSSQQAIEKSESNAEKWRANANEWRAAMTDRESRFAAAGEVGSEFKALRTEIQSLRESRAENMGGKGTWAAVGTLLGLLIGAAVAASRLLGR